MSTTGTSLYLLRHGETLFNVQHKTQGWCDSPLTERGREQACLAGRELAARGLTFDAWYSSTSERCCDTLELAAQAGWGSVPAYERIKGLKEFNFGAFEGKDQCLELFPHGDFYVPYGGEAEADVLARFVSTLDALMARGQERVLAVSHGGVGMMLFRAVVTDPEPGTVPFGNCICYHYRYDAARTGQGVAAFAWEETIVCDPTAVRWR